MREPINVVPARPFHLLLLVVTLSLLAGSACTGSDDVGSGSEGGSNTDLVKGPHGYGARIRRTADGVPHIWAEDDKGVFFGQGYASAQDHPCDLVDQILMVTSKRAATFGAGQDDANVNSDFGWAAMGLVARAHTDWVATKGDRRQVVESFAAGWNESFRKQGADGIQDWCTGADWMREITAEELYTYARSVALVGSGARLVGYIASATPPGAAEDPGAGGSGAQASAVLQPVGTESSPASNGWAIGSERTASKGGMLLGNPHFPWTGQLRFWEVQLSTADGMDVYGAQLIGLPGVGIGFTHGVAWTHTVSAGNRFTAYKMTLDPSDPTSYLMDGVSTPMESRDVSIDVLGEDGKSEKRTRTFYSTEFGPVLDFPGVGWTDSTTVSYRDANIDNDRLIEQYMAMDRATSLDELRNVQEKIQGIPLFNTVAADADGAVWYADTAATPDLSGDALTAYQHQLATDGLTKIASAAGAVLLDGSTSRDRWVDDPKAPWAGVLPWSDLPMIEREDYVMNANDSYWVPNAHALIDGDFSLLQGKKDTARSVRTLENLAVLDATGKSSPSGDDSRFTLDELTTAALRDEAYTETQWRDGVVERCRSAAAPVLSAALTDDSGKVVVPATAVDLGPACDVLGSWDGRYDVDSPGAVLWREVVGHLDYDTMWATPFDVAKPAVTPAGLAPAASGGDEVLVGLADAVALLDHMKVPLGAALGDQQYDARVPKQRLPVPGGLSDEGLTNVVSNSSSLTSTMEQQPDNPKPATADSALTEAGYPVNYGSSFIMAVDFSGDGPEARTILTYGEVGDLKSPLFTSQMKAFAEKKWKVVRFTEADIQADPDLKVADVSA